MARIEKTVFISYRRKDISWALAVYQYLTSQKYDVFFDFTSIPSGDFEQIIISNIRARAHFVLILTPTTLDRCSEPGDWLRREIETAMDEKRNIIPLFFDGFNFSSPSVVEKLTGKLAAINRYNGIDIPSGYFLEAMARLSRRYLDVPLDAVLHPVSTAVRKVVKEEQIAVSKALVQKWEDIKELIKPAEDRSVISEQTPIGTAVESPAPSRIWFGGKVPKASFRLYGIGVGVLLIVALGIAAINALRPNNPGNIVPGTGEVATNPVDAQPSVDSPVHTPTPKLQTSVPTETIVSATPTFTITPSPTPGIKSTMISAKDGMILLYVPAGEFMMGSDTGNPDEAPTHTVKLDSFWIDQTEVTNAMYAKCVADKKCALPRYEKSHTRAAYYGQPKYDDFPVIYVSWNAASAYCAWADRRLPTEAEWEKAASWDPQTNEKLVYPWGNDEPNNDLLNYSHIVEDTTKVGEYPDGASPYGALDMSGNVWEWTADWYDAGYYAKSRSSNPLGPLEPTLGQSRALRGGSWNNLAKNVRAALRSRNSQSSEYDYQGFRCARSE